MPSFVAQVDAVLQGEAPVAACLRRRLPEEVLRNSHLPMTSKHWPVPTWISDDAGRDGCSQSERPASHTRNDDTGRDSGAEGEGNGGFEAMEGSMIEGSGKALIRNGRIHLLEWRPTVDRRFEYDDVAPDACYAVPHTLNCRTARVVRKQGAGGRTEVEGSLPLVLRPIAPLPSHSS